MTIIKVDEMHCEKCVERIQKAMSGAGLDFEISLPEKTVTVNGCDKCLETAKEILQDLGF